MPHIQCRLWVDGVNEEAEVGELYWDPNRGRLGVNTVANHMLWFAALSDTGLRLAGSDVLTGLTAADGTANRLALDFSVDGTINIVNTAAGNAIVASFTADGALFNAATVSGTSRLGGLINYLLNGAVTVRRSVQPQNNQAIAVTNPSVLLAPNWQLWAGSAFGGALRGFVAEANNQAPPPGCPRALGVTCTAPCYEGGLRTFVHDTAALLGASVCHFSAYLLGPAGATVKMRVLTPNGVVAMLEIVGTGAWVRNSLTVDLSTVNFDPEDFIAFDVLYAPGLNSTWFVGGAQCDTGSIVQPLEVRPTEVERSLLRSIYAERRLTGLAVESASWELMPNYTAVEAVTLESLPISLSTTAFDSFGATVANSRAPIRAQLTAYRLPVLAESA